MFPQPPSYGGTPDNPLADAFILPRQPGETTYQYRQRRSLSKYGQTPYQRRIYLAQQRGIGISAARGHGIVGGETESQRRNRINQQRYGATTSQLRWAYDHNWLVAYNYTPTLTGMSWTQLHRLAARLRYMYEPPGYRVSPQMIYEAMQLERDGELEPGWAFERLWAKYDDTIAYREFRDKVPGNADWSEYQQVHVYIPQLAIQWWYYH